MSIDRKKIKDKKLIVEGSSDLYAIAELGNKSKLSNFNIINAESYTKIQNILTKILKELETEVVGIVVDADENLSKRWEEIIKLFSENNITIDENLPETGYIKYFEDTNFNKNIKIGIWIMPNNNLNGTLEDFINFLVPKDDELMPEIETHIKNIEDKNLHKYNPNNKTKAKIHSWISLQENPGTPIGQAINYKYFDLKHAECKNFINWLNDLFNS